MPMLANYDELVVFVSEIDHGVDVDVLAFFFLTQRLLTSSSARVVSNVAETDVTVAELLAGAPQSKDMAGKSWHSVFPP